MNRAVSFALVVVGGCVYFNAMYDARREFDDGVRKMREKSEIAARVQFDSVIAKTGRILEDHPGSKWADDAAILKARSELYTRKWESAIETAALAAALSDDESTMALAAGLAGVAHREIGETVAADSLLTLAIGADIDADDRALFLFQRGLARQQMGKAEIAAADLEAAATELNLSTEGRLTLSVALRDVGDYERSAQLAGQLLATTTINPVSPLYSHVDSLSVLDPRSVDTVVARLLQSPSLAATRTSTYHYLRGRAHLHSTDTTEALVQFETAIAVSSTATAAADAAYWVTELQLRSADTPDDLTALLDLYSVARRSMSSEIRTNAAARDGATRTFAGLMEAYDSRGATAAEAVLRAAELAGADLEAPAVARGLYLLYLDLAPESRWAAKAIFGAIAVSGHPPDPAWIEDRGQVTDADLRARLATLPADDPYRQTLASPDERRPMADSLYVLAEADLRRRLSEIRRLFDPSATFDTIPAAVDSVPADGRAEQ